MGRRNDATISALKSRIDRLENDVDVLQAEMGGKLDAGEPATYAKTRWVQQAWGLLEKQLKNKADLDVSGKVPTMQLPALALTNIHVVDDIAARDALPSPDEGDVAIVRSDYGVRATYIYEGTTWEPMTSPADVTEAELAAAVVAGLAYAAGDGLTWTGRQYNVVGTAGRILVGEDSVDIDPAYQGQESIVVTGTTIADATNAEVIAAETTRAIAAEGALADRLEALEPSEKGRTSPTEREE